ncbi:MAG: hypothetical protein KDA71_00495, partial [Planctomycetales bacterium]|nr:hypothetical protein [Planctomycetales bacterium]
YRRRDNKIVTDIDLDAFWRFAPMADIIYEIDPKVSPLSVCKLPPPHDPDECPHADDVVAQRREKLVLVISPELFAKIKGTVDQIQRGKRPDPRYLGQAWSRTFVDSQAMERLRQDIAKSLKTGKAVSPEPGTYIDDEHPGLEFASGASSGLTISMVPAGSVAAELAMRAGALKKGSREQRLGLNVGVAAGGIGQIVVGCGAMGLGLGASSTGAGAPAGIVITAEGAMVVANGALAVCTATADTIDLLVHWREEAAPSSSPNPSPSPSPSPSPKPAATPSATPTKAPVATKPTPPTNSSPSPKQPPPPTRTTTRFADGTRVTRVRKPDGTQIKTTRYPDGRTVTETKQPNGTTTTTRRNW